MIDVVGDGCIVLSQRVIRQFSQMYDRTEPIEVLWSHPTNVLAQSERSRPLVVEEPSVPVKTAVHADYVEPALQERRAEHRADIAIRSSDQ